MPHDEFLRLLQSTEANRKCQGKDCIDVTDANVEQASVNGAMRLAHDAEAVRNGGHPKSCPGCADIRQQEIALRETMHSQGVDFPVDVWES